MKIKKEDIDQLKSIIREVLMLEGSFPGAAGVVVVKKFDNCWKILGLRSSKQKHNGLFDLTKGMIDNDESSFEAAIRETYEEAGIIPEDLNFIWGNRSMSCNNVIMYIASTDSEPVIKPNPKTGSLEHTEARWLTIDEFENECIDYLKPVGMWVRNIVNKS